MQNLMKILITALLCCSAIIYGDVIHYSQQKLSFNGDWYFTKGDIEKAESKSFDHQNWRHLNLPHDWAIEGPFSKKYSARNGGLPVFGTAWYRKNFVLPMQSKDKLVRIYFDGVMANSEVFVNGHFVGKRPFGYIGFHYEISRYLNPVGEQNVIAVKVAPENYSSRWYSGAGIYRNTWIEFDDQSHFLPWSSHVTTPEVSDDKAIVNIETKINLGSNESMTWVVDIVDDNGLRKAQHSQEIAKSSDAVSTLSAVIELPNPRRWDIEDPYRYKLVNRLLIKGKEVDVESLPLGVRTIEYKPDDGFWLNGRRVQIQGVSLHHDNGPLGAVVNYRAIERKLEIMQSMGANAIRTAHNPPSPELVELADRMGILLQVEAFDTWKLPKPTVDNGYHKYYDQWAERDVADMVKIHRNNPSVIMWSIGNEVYEQRKKNGWQQAKFLASIVRREDSSRLVTAGLSDYPKFISSKIADELDIIGLNYKATEYEDILKSYKGKPVLGSETSSVVSTRGAYHFPVKPLEKHPSKHVSSYDMYAPYWAYIPDIEWYNLDANPAVMGEFIWTGFDYLGEPTPYGGQDHGDKFYWNQDWPARSSSFGAVDLSGFPKDRYYFYQSRWLEKPMVHLLPHWNWPEKVGHSIPVVAYSNAEQVELFVNGKSQGRKTMGVDTMRIPVSLRYRKKQKFFESPYRLKWDVEYQPGEIKVVAYNKGQVVAQKTIVTASAPKQLNLKADRTVLTADGYDLSFITVDVQDEAGNIVPTANNKLTFEVTGPGEIAAVGNGDSVTVEPFIADYRHAFNGKALLVICSKKGDPGEIRVKVYSDKLDSAEILLRSESQTGHDELLAQH